MNVGRIVGRILKVYWTWQKTGLLVNIVMSAMHQGSLSGRKTIRNWEELSRVYSIYLSRKNAKIAFLYLKIGKCILSLEKLNHSGEIWAKDRKKWTNLHEVSFCWLPGENWGQSVFFFFRKKVGSENGKNLLLRTMTVKKENQRASNCWSN